MTQRNIKYRITRTSVFQEA